MGENRLGLAARNLSGEPGSLLCAADLIRILRPGARFFFSELNLLTPHVLAEKKIGFPEKAAGKLP